MPKSNHTFDSAIYPVGRAVLSLLKAIEEFGGDEADVARIEHDKGLRESVARLIVQQESPIHHITLAGGRSRLELISAGGYDWINPDISIEHYPINASAFAHRCGVVLVHFHFSMTATAVLEHLIDRGFRPLVLDQLLALGADQNTRELQRQYPIVALGSVWLSPDGQEWCPYLAGNDSNRQLLLGLVGGDWHRYCRFAALQVADPSPSTCR